MSVMSGEGALSVFARAKELEGQGRSIIHLELGEPDFHAGPSVVEAVAQALAEGKDRYCPVAGVPALRDELAAYLLRTRQIHVSPANIVMAPGCKMALFFAMMALLEPGDEVLYPDPGFPGYPSIALGLGAVPVSFELSPRHHFQPDLAEIVSKITPRTRMIITNSPGNPTGTVYTDAVQRGIAELAVKHDLWVLSDEIYARIIYGGEYISMLRYPGMAERTLLLDGFSKSFAMTGWRLGYTVAPPDVVPALKMLAINSYTCVAEFTQYAAIDALRDREGNTPRMVAEFMRRRNQFVYDLNQVPGFHCDDSTKVPGFRCTTPEGAFYSWADLRGTGSIPEELCRILLEEAGVAAIPGAAFGPSGQDFVRFACASSVDNLREAAARIMKASAAWQGTLVSR
jgi:aspartate aminotransferase